MKEYRVIQIRHSEKGIVYIVEKKLWIFWIRAHHWKKYFYYEKQAYEFAKTELKQKIKVNTV